MNNIYREHGMYTDLRKFLKNLDTNRERLMLEDKVRMLIKNIAKIQKYRGILYQRADNVKRLNTNRFKGDKEETTNFI